MNKTAFNTLMYAALLAAAAVALGALGAHALKEAVKTGAITLEQVNSFDTGAKYQMYHALALMLVGILQLKYPTVKKLRYAAYCFYTGILFFSGSVYLLSTRGITGLSGIGFLGPITPVGGILFMVGWILIALTCIALKSNEQN